MRPSWCASELPSLPSTPPLGVHACCTHLQCCHKQFFKAMWHPITNSPKKNVIFYLALPMMLGLSTVFTHLKSFRMFYDHQIAVRELKGLHTSYRISYGPKWCSPTAQRCMQQGTRPRVESAADSADLMRIMMAASAEIISAASIFMKTHLYPRE